MNIALVTYKDQGAFASPTAENEDDLLLKFLQSKGLRIEKVIWNDVHVKWETYDLAILKSPWDYFDLIEDFYIWLSLLQTQGVKLLNPIDIVKWNADKHYLEDIKNAGLAVTESFFLRKQTPVRLSTYFSLLNATKFIVKPCVSGGSKNTFKVTPENVEEVNLRLNALLANEDFIIQPFLNEIEEDGEWSFLFFNGKFSHALLKKAKTGDFRVQHSFGGTIHPKKPSEDLIHTAQQYVAKFAKDCLYARVDGAIVKDRFFLMELELIEPFLFLGNEEEYYQHYYDALRDLIKI